MGVGRALKWVSEETGLVALEPSNLAVLSGGEPGPHKVEGIGTGSVPPHYDPDLVGEVLTVSEADAVETARQLAREEGIFSGVSSGLNVSAACRLAAKLAADQIVVTVAVDSGLKYLDGDLYKPAWGRRCQADQPVVGRSSRCGLSEAWPGRFSSQ
jgi:cysteine synthase A